MEGPGREYISERISRGNDVRSELVTYLELEMLDLEEKGVGKGHLGLVFTFKLCQFVSQTTSLPSSQNHGTIIKESLG